MIGPFKAVQDLIRRFHMETGELPVAIDLPPRLFASVWADCRQITTIEHRPGLFTEGFPPIDAGNPVIEMFCDRGYVKIRCSESIYQRELRGPDLSGSTGEEG